MTATVKKASTNGKQDTITLQRLTPRILEVTVEGTAPYISHNWAAKSKQMMLDKSQGKTTKKLPKDPEQEFEDTIYRLDDGRCGIPATAFRAAIVSGARSFDNVTMVEAKSMVHVEGEWSDHEQKHLIPIVGSDPTMWENPVRVGMGTADIRYRAMFKLPWSAHLAIRFLPSQISDEAILALVDAGGFGGVGDWRPSSPKSMTGSFGTFRVVDDTVEVHG